MARILLSAIASFVLVAAAYAQTSAAAQASASQSSSVSANSSGAQANSSSSAKASQSTNASHAPAQAAVASQLQSGSTVHAELTKPVDVRKNKPGDEVVAKTTQDVKSDGKVVIPKGSKIVGHVTEANARAKGQENSSLGLAFDHAVLKNGTTIPVSFAVQALGNSRTAIQDDSMMASDTMAMAPSAASSVRSSGGGLVGGVGATAGAVTNTAVGTTGTLGSASQLGGSVAGSSPLNSTSNGVVGMPNLNLVSTAASSSSSMITSKTTNVRLDSGTEMILRANH
jgi:hypothetical protein